MFNLPEISKRTNRIYGKLYERIVKDFIEIYSELGIKLSPKAVKAIVEKTKLTERYISDILLVTGKQATSKTKM